jgi:hypothetical protein
MKGGDYDFDQPPPMIPTQLNAQLQKQASQFPPFVPGETLVHYSQRTKLPYDDVMAAYGAMLNRTGFEDPGQPSEALRTPDEVAADNARSKKEVDAWQKGFSNGVAQQITGSVLDSLKKGSSIASTIAGLTGQEELGTAADVIGASTDTIGKLLGLPDDLSDEAVADRVAQSVLAISGDNQSGGGLLVGGDLNSYMPDFSILKTRLSGADLYSTAMALVNATANHYAHTPDTNSEKQAWLTRFRNYIQSSTGLPQPQSAIDVILPKIEWLQEILTGAQLKSICQLLLANAEDDIQTQTAAGFKIPDIDELEERVHDYTNFIG